MRLNIYKFKIERMKIKSPTRNWKTLTKTYKPRNRNIKARDVSVLTDEKGILDRWNEHFKGEKIAQLFEIYENVSCEYIDEGLEEPSLHEIQEIIINLKRMEAPGIDNINAELQQAAGPQMTERIQELTLNIWRYERISNE